VTQRLPEIDLHRAPPAIRKALDGDGERFGTSPQVMRIMANSAAALDGYLALGAALERGTLDARIRQQIALAVAEVNACRQCVQDHAAAGKALGLDDPTIRAARRACSSDPRIEAALQFAQKVAEYRGDLTDDEFDRMRRSGYSNEEIAEIIANVVLSLYSNYFSITAQPC
jgi:uncharacterized peroxidase-related enzyme